MRNGRSCFGSERESGSVAFRSWSPCDWQVRASKVPKSRVARVSRRDIPRPDTSEKSPLPQVPIRANPDSDKNTFFYLNEPSTSASDIVRFSWSTAHSAFVSSSLPTSFIIRYPACSIARHRASTHHSSPSRSLRRLIRHHVCRFQNPAPCLHGLGQKRKLLAPRSDLASRPAPTRQHYRLSMQVPIEDNC